MASEPAGPVVLPVEPVEPVEPPTVALVGTTASGKSAVAMAVAEAVPGLEIVSVDSMCVYRGMDLGTAKPPPASRAAVPHHLINVVEPWEEFTASQFQRAVAQALRGIAARGGTALLVGGTGLYLRAVVDRLRLPGRWPDVAAGLERQADRAGGLDDLYRRLERLDPVAASRIQPTNRRRIVRALEVTLGSGAPFSSFGPGLEAYPPTGTFQVGIPFDPEVVDRRIAERFRQWLSQGLVEEVARLAAEPRGLSRTARQALGYRELLAHVEEGAPLEECVALAVQRTRSYARRQWSWFRRDPRVRWVGPGEDPAEVVVAALVDRARRGPPGARSPAPGRETGGVNPTISGGLSLSKHQGAGNDFLVLVDAAGDRVLSADLARRLCDRRFGVGADGVIRVSPGAGGADLAMELRNADGSVAAMSGNGVRCLAQAAVEAGMVASPRFTVATAAGLRTVSYEPGDRPGEGWARVDMGPARVGPEEPAPLAGTRARLVDVGNPHLVLVGPDRPEDLDVATVGARLQEAWPDGINVEFVARGPGPDELVLRVWERGVGETRACGTGSCAAAAVARSWGLVGDEVQVANPGGVLHVTLGRAPEDPVFLAGPVRRIAGVEVDPGVLEPAPVR